MATRSWAVNIDSNTRGTDLDYGNTLDQHNPTGRHQSVATTFRSFIKFNVDLTSMVTITSAILYMKSTTETHIAFDTGTLRVKRNTSSLANTSGGSGEGTWSSSARPTRSTEPSSTTTGQSAATNVTSTHSTWDTIDVTSIAQAWLAGSTNYGVTIKAESESSNADAWEFYSADSGSDPYISVTYTTNVAPQAPTLSAPADGYRIPGTDPTIGFSHNDSDGDALAKYHLQIATDAGFTSLFYDGDNLTTGISGNSVSTALSSVPGMGILSRGTLYYWRVATYSATGVLTVGAWSGYRTFKPNVIPVVTMTDPASSSILAHLVYTAGSGWATPRLYVEWTYSDTDSDAQQRFSVIVLNDGDGSTAYDSGAIYSATARSMIVPLNLTEGNKYRIKVLVHDGYEYSAWSTTRTVRARWGYSTHRKDVSIGGVAPTSWSVTVLSTTSGSTSSAIMEYNSSDDGTTNLGTSWQSSLSAVNKRKFVHFRVWLMCWGSATPVSASLDAITISASGLVLSPDGWGSWTDSAISDAGASIEIGTKTFGTQSLRMDGTGSWKGVRQKVPLDPYTDYVFQYRAMVIGAGGAAYINLGGADLAAVGPSVNGAWTTVTTPYFNSGGNAYCYVYLSMSAASGNSIFYDGIKIEKGRVASPWMPGLVGDATTIDANGVQVDASKQGVFRLRGSGGGTRDTVKLGTKGLVFGNDVQLYSATAGVIQIDNVSGSADQSLAIGDDSFLYDVDISNALGLKGNSDPTQGMLVFGSGKDTNLYRGAQDRLQTDDNLQVGGFVDAAGGFKAGSNYYLRFVPIVQGADVSGANGPGSTKTLVELTSIPNDSNIVAVSAIIGIRDNSGTAGTAGGANNTLTVWGYSDNTKSAGLTYSSGVFGRGGFGVVDYIPVGGTNNRQIYYSTTTNTNTSVSYIWPIGYWTKA